MSQLRLQEKVAIITGAASGIGEAAARLFASHGALVVIADIQDELGSAVAASIGHDKCIYKHCDVSDEKQVEETVEMALSTYGRLDIMYSNAGFLGKAAAIQDLDLSELNRVMAVNVNGAAAAIKHAARAMIARGTHGSIICTASTASLMGGFGPATYIASKHAVLGLVRSAAGELAKLGVRVNCVSPSAVATQFGQGSTKHSPQVLEAIMASIKNPMGVILKASEVAEAALFLASDESKYVNGHNLVVDGGTTCYSWSHVPKEVTELLEQSAKASAV